MNPWFWWTERLFPLNRSPGSPIRLNHRFPEDAAQRQYFLQTTLPGRNSGSVKNSNVAESHIELPIPVFFPLTALMGHVRAVMDSVT
jgi:hypothetical protein